MVCLCEREEATDTTQTGLELWQDPVREMIACKSQDTNSIAHRVQPIAKLYMSKSSNRIPELRGCKLSNLPKQQNDADFYGSWLVVFSQYS